MYHQTTCAILRIKISLNLYSTIKKFEKIMDSPGIEPGASRMQSECDTTTPQTRFIIQCDVIAFNQLQG